jgi:hypothetical protein
MGKQRVLRIEYGKEYPWVSIVMAVALILASPFVSSWLNYVALAICL